MASLLFEDYDFPREMWDSSTRTFTTPVDTLLSFCPHIVTQLKKETQDQEPIKQEKGTFEKIFESSKSNLSGAFSTSLAEKTFRFCMEAATAYLQSTNDRRNRQRYHSVQYGPELEDEEEEEEIRLRELRTRRKEYEKQDEDQIDGKEIESRALIKRERMSLMTKSLTSIAALTLSLYSAHRASLSWGEITFQSQLELLTTHVKAALESTTAWIKDRKDMNDPVPDILLRDVARLQELLTLIERLDSRREKRMETAGWSISAAGSLSVLGGIALGWTDQALTLSGAAMVGGIVFGIISRNRWNGPAWKASKSVLEARLTSLVREIASDAAIREKTMEQLEQKVRRPNLYYTEEMEEYENKDFVSHGVKVELNDTGTTTAATTTANQSQRNRKQPVGTAV
ncbi:hypothetical protein NQZ79_g2380 [Umbelopsis isabellina]|nr:hypothetical protein NQZ79_g2380 [Umbelopsis isabellina]